MAAARREPPPAAESRLHIQEATETALERQNLQCRLSITAPQTTYRPTSNAQKRQHLDVSLPVSRYVELCCHEVSQFLYGVHKDLTRPIGFYDFFCK